MNSVLMSAFLPLVTKAQIASSGDPFISSYAIETIFITTLCSGCKWYLSSYIQNTQSAGQLEVNQALTNTDSYRARSLLLWNFVRETLILSIWTCIINLHTCFQLNLKLLCILAVRAQLLSQRAWLDYVQVHKELKAEALIRVGIT